MIHPMYCARNCSAAVSHSTPGWSRHSVCSSYSPVGYDLRLVWLIDQSNVRLAACDGTSGRSKGRRPPRPSGRSPCRPTRAPARCTGHGSARADAFTWQLRYERRSRAISSPQRGYSVVLYGDCTASPRPSRRRGTSRAPTVLQAEPGVAGLQLVDLRAPEPPLLHAGWTRERGQTTPRSRTSPAASPCPRRWRASGSRTASGRSPPNRDTGRPSCQCGCRTRSPRSRAPSTTRRSTP